LHQLQYFLARSLCEINKINTWCALSRVSVLPRASYPNIQNWPQRTIMLIQSHSAIHHFLRNTVFPPTHLLWNNTWASSIYIRKPLPKNCRNLHISLVELITEVHNFISGFMPLKLYHNQVTNKLTN
jgi:hypothetical protein